MMHLTTSPLLGRQRELADLADLLANPACRLLTIVGVGGVGKTQLALAATHALAQQFADGVQVVYLQGVARPDLLPTAVADGLQLHLAGNQPPSTQLATYLQNKQLLLLLDNMEHLLASAPMLAEWLSAAPELRLMVTSREALNMAEEWLYPLQGLPYPPQGTAADPQTHPAVALFVRRAQQVRPSFDVVLEGAAVGQICQLVEGLPLALDLAAAWVKTIGDKLRFSRNCQGLIFRVNRA